MQKICTTLAMLATLCACGGGGGNPGGGGGGGTPLPTTFNLDAAVERALSVGTSQMASANSVGNTVTLSLAFMPQGDALFEGSVRRRTLETAQARINGVAQPSDASTLYYTTGPLRIIGNTDSDGSYSVATSTGNLPTAASVGQSGPFLTSITYTDASKANPIGRAVQTWSLEAASSSSTAFACLNTTLQTALGQPTGESGSECYRIDTSGNISGLRVTVTTGGQTVIFQ